MYIYLYLNKKHIIINIEDEEWNKFGRCFNSKIDKVYEWIYDSKSFLFSIESNGRMEYLNLILNNKTNLFNNSMHYLNFEMMISLFIKKKIKQIYVLNNVHLNMKEYQLHFVKIYFHNKTNHSNWNDSSWIIENELKKNSKQNNEEYECFEDSGIKYLCHSFM